MKRRLAAAALIAFALSVGCFGSKDDGPSEVRWDRDTCARCVMAVSDRSYAAQVRGAPAGERLKTYFFDEVGCAVIWLADQSWKEDDRTRQWVISHKTGQWIDMHSAWYYTGHNTPMDYGLGADSERSDGALGFAEAVTHIQQRDDRGGRRHGG